METDYAVRRWSGDKAQRPQLVAALRDNQPIVFRAQRAKGTACTE